jgi:hypothetical protein
LKSLLIIPNEYRIRFPAELLYFSAVKNSVIGTVFKFESKASSQSKLSKVKTGKIILFSKGFAVKRVPFWSSKKIVWFSITSVVIEWGEDSRANFVMMW